MRGGKCSRVHFIVAQFIIAIIRIAFTIKSVIMRWSRFYFMIMSGECCVARFLWAKYSAAQQLFYFTINFVFQWKLIKSLTSPRVQLIAIIPQMSWKRALSHSFFFINTNLLNWLQFDDPSYLWFAFIYRASYMHRHTHISQTSPAMQNLSIKWAGRQLSRECWDAPLCPPALADPFGAEQVGALGGKKIVLHECAGQWYRCFSSWGTAFLLNGELVDVDVAGNQALCQMSRSVGPWQQSSAPASIPAKRNLK